MKTVFVMITSAGPNRDLSNLPRCQEAPDDVGITDPVDDRHDPEIARSPEQQTKKQTDREDRREHWDGERGLRRKVIPMERAKGVEHICAQNTGERTPSANEFGLQNPAVNNLLIEAKEKVGNEDVPQSSIGRKAGPESDRSRLAKTSGKTRFAITRS